VSDPTTADLTRWTEHARALHAAVRADDPDAVAAALASCDNLAAVAVVLAGNLPERSLPVPTFWRSRCGTNDGYRDHLLLDEPTCGPCKAAHAADNARMRRAAKERALLAAKRATELGRPRIVPVSEHQRAAARAAAREDAA